MAKIRNKGGGRSGQTGGAGQPFAKNRFDRTRKKALENALKSGNKPKLNENELQNATEKLRAGMGLVEAKEAEGLKLDLPVGHKRIPKQPRRGERLSSWKQFVGDAQADLDTLQRHMAHLEQSVVFLGGGKRSGAGESAGEGNTLAEQIAKRGIPIRIADRPYNRGLVQAALGANDKLRIETVATSASAELPTSLRVQLKTHEIEKAVLMHGKATAYVVMPGGVEALWDLFALWALAGTDKIEPRPILLVGREWRRWLEPLIKEGLANGTIDRAQVDLLTFVDNVDNAMSIIESSHARYKNSADTGHAKFRAQAQIDLLKLDELVDGFDPNASVALGSARLGPGTPAYEHTLKRTELAGVSTTTGAGPGIMEAASKGAKQAGNGAKAQGVSIQLKHEEAPNLFIDKGHGGEGRSLEIRQRGLLSQGSSYTIDEGGVGTWYELAQIWHLMAGGQVPKRSVILSPFYADFLKRFLNDARREGTLDAQADQIARDWMFVLRDTELEAAKLRGAARWSEVDE